MTLHPMYREPNSLPEREERWLRQGDIIDLQKLITSGALDGHQEYIKQGSEFFCGFCVLTQTCDLVRETEEEAQQLQQKRGKPNKRGTPRQPVEFIGLAMIRRLRYVLNKTHISDSDARRDTRQFLKTIINHNYNKSGYFFLHQNDEQDRYIGEDWVVDLRTIFSLVSDYHYTQIIDSRLLCLNEVYANKLGWMVGYLFSRIATPEWIDFKMPHTEDQFVDTIFDQLPSRQPHSLHKERETMVNIMKKTSKLNGLKEDQLDELLQIAKQKFKLKDA
jgi:hypothetical protein